MYEAASTGGAGTATEGQRERYEDAIKFLSLVGQGKLRLATSAGEDMVPAHATAEISSEARRMTRTSLDRVM